MRRRARRSFLPEQLEERTLLSAVGGGDVSIAVDDLGNFAIEGDEHGNVVWIKQDSGHGHYGEGSIWVWGEGTTINGQTYDMDNPLGVDGFTGDIAVALGEGDDTFYIYGIHAPGEVNVELGTGANEVYVDETSVDGSMRLFGGADADEFYVDRTTVGSKLRVQTFGGADGLYVSDIETRTMYLNSGRHSDGVYVYNTDVSRAGTIRGGKGTDYLGVETNYSSIEELGEDRVLSFEEFGVADNRNVMDVKLDDAIQILDRGRAGQEQHDQAIEQLMEALFVSNVVPLPTNTNGDPNDPDEQDFQEHQQDLDRAIEALTKHVNSSKVGTDGSKADAADARNFLQLTQEALQAIAAQTAHCDPGDGTNLQGEGCQLLEADDEGGNGVDQILDGIFSRQVRSPFPIFTTGSLEPNEVVITTGPLADGECSGTIKEFFGIKAVVTAREIPIWVEPWFARARIVGTKTVFALEFVPAEYIKTISVCNNGGSLQTSVDAVTVHDRGLMHFWRFLNNK